MISANIGSRGRVESVPRNRNFGFEIRAPQSRTGKFQKGNYPFSFKTKDIFGCPGPTEEAGILKSMKPEY